MERMIGELFTRGNKWYRMQPGRWANAMNCHFCAVRIGATPPELTCRDVGICKVDERTDRRNVMAVECYVTPQEEAKEAERQIGEKFETAKSKTGWAKTVLSNGLCSRMGFYGGKCIFDGACIPMQGIVCGESMRTDRRDVCFIECEAPDQLDTCCSPDSGNCHSRYNGACLGAGECSDMEVNLDFDRPPKADVDGWSEEPAVSPVEELAGAHWAYIKAVLQAHGLDDKDALVIGHHYRTAFIHGYKHGRDSVKGCETCRHYESSDADNRPCKDCRVVDLPKWEGKR